MNLCNFSPAKLESSVAEGGGLRLGVLSISSVYKPFLLPLTAPRLSPCIQQELDNTDVMARALKPEPFAYINVKKN